ncbi:MAG: hypothetical protein P8O04_05570 [Flavobacteriaceae bacterium]|nr:hypothetical protein [Flavobacteriaceae bacterium]
MYKQLLYLQMLFKKNTNYDFEARKQYEETFVRNNSALIQDITGASIVYNISQTPMDRNCGIDAILQIDREMWGVALRVRKPQYKKYSKRFTIGHHITKPNSQMHSILNSVNNNQVFYPHFILQVNGVDDNGYCEECNAILIQTNIFACWLFDKIESGTVDDEYVSHLDAYEYEFSTAFTQTDTGVDLYNIKNNKIEYVWTNKESD